MSDPPAAPGHPHPIRQRIGAGAARGASAALLSQSSVDYFAFGIVVTAPESVAPSRGVNID